MTSGITWSRIELKYRVPAGRLAAVLDWLEARGASPGRVATAYFDRPDRGLSARARRDPARAVSLRLRSYADDGEARWVEVKRRDGVRVEKRRFRAGRSLVADLLRGTEDEDRVTRELESGQGPAAAEAYRLLRGLAPGPLEPLGAVTALRWRARTDEGRMRLTLDRDLCFHAPAVDGEAWPGPVARRETGGLLEIKGASPCAPAGAGFDALEPCPGYSKFRVLLGTLDGRLDEHVD